MGRGLKSKPGPRPKPRTPTGEHLRNAVYDYLVVKEPTLEIMEKFQPGVTVIKEGEPIYSRKVGKVFSAVIPKRKYRAWWRDMMVRSANREIIWLQ